MQNTLLAILLVVALVMMGSGIRELFIEWYSGASPPISRFQRFCLLLQIALSFFVVVAVVVLFRT